MTASVPDYTEKEWTADGVSTAFSFQTKVLEAADIKVWLREGATLTLQTLGLHYSLSGLGDPSGVTINFVTAPASPKVVRARRQTVPKQTIDYGDLTKVPGDTTEAQLDRFAMALQDHQSAIDLELDLTGLVAAAAQSADEAAASEAAASASEQSAAASAAAAGAASGRLEIAAFAELATKFVYSAPGPGQQLVAAGDVITWREMGFAYKVALSGAADAPLDYTGAGGVKLYVISDGPLNVLAFGAVGDRVTDDYAALQKACSAVPEGGAIYLPKRGGTLPSYYTSQTLVLTQNDVSVFSDPTAEYTEGLFSDQPIDIISVRAYGFRAHHLVFVGNGSTDVFATTNGIRIDRSSVGDAETYANLDAFVTNCFFLNLKDCIRGKGRNVLAEDCMFSQSKRGVIGELHTYAGGTVSSFRGWRVLSNRFHNMGSQYHSATSVEPVPANLSLLDSWCVQMPLDSNMVSHIEVKNNNYDVGMAGFYKGPLAACVIDDNVGYLVNPALVYSPLTSAPAISLTANYVQSVSGNKVSARLFVDERRGHTIATSHIVVNGTRNLHIENNALLNCTDRSLVLTETNGLRLSDTDIINANTRFAFDSVQRNAAQILTANNVRVKDLDISYNLGGTPYDTGLVMTGTGIKVRDTTVTEATTKYSIPAASLMPSDDDALPWQTPSMTNGFVLDAANSQGYRKGFDGFVEIDVTVTAGTDNVQAFFLPAGYRPSKPVIIPSIGTFSGARAIVNPGGSVVIDFDAGAPSSCTIHAAFAAT